MQRHQKPASSDLPAHYLTSTRRAALCGPFAWLGISAFPLTAAQAQSPQHTDSVWQDPSRNRAVPVRLRWPDAQTPVPVDGWPVIVYSHGLGDTASGGGVWGRARAAAGFVVVHVQHPGSHLESVRSALRTGLGRASLKDATSAAQLFARLADVSFVIDEIARQKSLGKQWANARSDAVGVAGHSFGAHTTLGAGGQAFQCYASLREPRIAALVALCPTIPSIGDAPSAFANITRPTLCITGTLDGDVIGNGATPDRRAAVFGALPIGRKALLLLRNADHATFGGNTDSTGRTRLSLPREPDARQLEAQHHLLIAHVTANWWRTHLQADSAAAAALSPPAGLGASDIWRTGYSLHVSFMPLSLAGGVRLMHGRWF